MSYAPRILELLKKDVIIKTVRGSGTSGRVYVPKDLIGKEVAVMSVETYERILKLVEQYREISKFLSLVLSNTKQSRMFSVVTRTWNPVTGCLHNCMYCWARRLAETRLKNSKRYRDGFKPRLNKEEFRVRFCEGDLVFVSDMGDLFGDFIKDEWIEAVLDYMRKFPRTYFLLLTKNPQRYHEFIDKFPPNAILGATIETNRDDLYIEHAISGAPLPSKRYEAMKELKWHLKFVSIEPILDFDLDTMVKWIEDIAPVMVYVGYDNYNNKLPEPPLSKTMKLIERLSEITIVVRKTIRPAWYEGLQQWQGKR